MLDDDLAIGTIVVLSSWACRAELSKISDPCLEEGWRVELRLGNVVELMISWVVIGASESV